MKAFYDSKPSVLEAVGNGNYLYRYGITEVQVEEPEQSESEATEPVNRTQWECEEVTIIGKPTSNGITAAVITERFPSDFEQKLVNEYNAAQLGLYGAKTSEEAKAKIERYKNMLTERAALKAQVDADCEDLDID